MSIRWNCPAPRHGCAPRVSAPIDSSPGTSSFAALPEVLAAEGIGSADVILADLGVSSMQHDTPSRGFSYKGVGPLDLRMNPLAGEPASALLARLSEAELAAILTANADEPHALFIARLLKQQPVETTHAFERLVRTGLTAAMPHLSKAEVKMSVRRTFQALRIARERRVRGPRRAPAGAAAVPGAGRPGGDPHVPFRRGSAGEEGVPVRRPERASTPLPRPGGSIRQGGDVVEPPRFFREAAVGRPRASLTPGRCLALAGLAVCGRIQAQAWLG